MVDFSAGAVIAMLGLVLGSQVATAFILVTHSDLERRFKQHTAKYHTDDDA